MVSRFSICRGLVARQLVEFYPKKFSLSSKSIISLSWFSLLSLCPLIIGMKNLKVYRIFCWLLLHELLVCGALALCLHVHGWYGVVFVLCFCVHVDFGALIVVRIRCDHLSNIRDSKTSKPFCSWITRNWCSWVCISLLVTCELLSMDGCNEWLWTNAHLKEHEYSISSQYNKEFVRLFLCP